MSNMTIENVGGFLKSGNIEQVFDRGKTIAQPATPSIEGLEKPDSFLEMLKNNIDRVNDIQNQADHAAKELVAGRNKNIHETMLMMEKADMSFKLLMQVRNKVIDAYREIMRMQV